MPLESILQGAQNWPPLPISNQPYTYWNRQFAGDTGYPENPAISPRGGYQIPDADVEIWPGITYGDMSAGMGLPMGWGFTPSGADALAQSVSAGQGSGGGYSYSAPTSGGTSGGDIEWIIGDYNVGEGSPDWWRPFTVKNQEHLANPQVAATIMMNAMIGSGQLSGEDSRTLAKQLYAMWGQKTGDNPWDIYSDKFDASKPTDPSQDPYGGSRLGKTFDPFISRQQQLLGQTGPGTITEDRFTVGRAEEMLQALSKAREATVGGNVHKWGSMYGSLQNIIGALQSRGNARTRADRLSVLGELDPLLAQLQGSPETAGLGALGRMIAEPFYSNLPPQLARDEIGNYQFGNRNKFLT